MKIERQYIIDEHNNKVAVQLDIETFEKIENVLENYGLVNLMQQSKENDPPYDLNQALAYYQTLDKAG